jgi:hypothetical protein
MYRGTGHPFPSGDSKLTQVLRDSIIGKNFTAWIIAMTSPGLGSWGRLDTWRFAGRVKQGNSPKQRQQTTASTALDEEGADLQQNKLRGFSPQANYTDRTTAACRRSWCQLMRNDHLINSVRHKHGVWSENCVGL